MHSSAKPSRQCVEAAKRANRILGMIKRMIVSREQDVVLRLYKSLVRPHLEYCVQAWSPYLREDIGTLEQIQRRATKMIRGLGKLTYEESLMRCGLTHLEKRRTRGDLIDAYKIMTGKEAILAHKFFEVSMENRTRGHGYKLYKTRTGIRRNKFFRARVVNPWNDLDEKTATVDTVDKFKRQLSSGVGKACNVGEYFTSGGQHALWGPDTTFIPQCKTPQTQVF